MNESSQQKEKHYQAESSPNGCFKPRSFERVYYTANADILTFVFHSITYSLSEVFFLASKSLDNSHLHSKTFYLHRSPKNIKTSLNILLH